MSPTRLLRSARKANPRSTYTAEWDEPDAPDCAWCGGQCDQPRPYPNTRGELFCSPGHRSASNRALRRLTGEPTRPPKKRNPVQPKDNPNVIRLSVGRIRPSFDRSTQVQSLLFANYVWSVAGAKRWAKGHGFRYGDADDYAANVRLRQHDPADYRPATFRTITLDAQFGIKAIIGVPKLGKGHTTKRKANPVRSYRGVSYTQTAGVYRLTLAGQRITVPQRAGLATVKHLIDEQLAADSYVSRVANPCAPCSAKRRNPGVAVGQRVQITDGRTGRVVALRGGAMADVDVGKGIVLRQPIHTLLHMQSNRRGSP